MTPAARAFLPSGCATYGARARRMWVSVPLSPQGLKPHGHGCADGRGKREPLPPRCKGKHQWPFAQPVAPANAVRRDEKKRLQPVGWSLEQCWRPQRLPRGAVQDGSGWRCAAALVWTVAARAFLPSLWVALVPVAVALWVSVPLSLQGLKPHGHGCADGRGKREPLPPRCKGKHQWPFAQPVAPANAVRRDEKKRLQPVGWSLEQCWQPQRLPRGVVHTAAVGVARRRL